MEQNEENKIKLEDKLAEFYKRNNKKIYIFVCIIIVIIASIFLLKINEKKKNNIIAEKYIEANLNLALNNKEKSIELYEQIIFSNNKFYSILALNTILEKNLEKDEGKILNYFAELEKIKNTQEQMDLITFKKALYLLKFNKKKKGILLLQGLVEKNSELKFLAEEIINK